MRVALSAPPPGFRAAATASPDRIRALEDAVVAARADEARFRGLVESIQAIPYIADWDTMGTIRYISPQVEALLGYPPEHWYRGGDQWAPSIHPDDRERVHAEAARTFAAEEEFAAEYRIMAADGRVVWIAERETIVRDAAGRPAISYGVMFDVTRMKTAEAGRLAAENALREERDLAQRYLDVACTLLLVLDADGSIQLLNQHGGELLGHPAGSLIGRDWFDIAVPADRREASRARFRAVMAGGQSLAGASQETVLLTASGERRTMAWRHTVLHAPDGTPTGTLSSGEDITDQRHAEAEIRRLAYHDHLTGLANRTHFDAQLRAAVEAAPAAGHAIGLLFLDLDNFKLVNDSLGHAVGDELLSAVAGRLVGVSGSGTLGRHGGDEFLVLLDALPAEAEAAAAAAQAAADALAARLEEPFGIAGHALRVDVSIGIAVFPHDAADAGMLMRLADAAMYRAKGRSSVPRASR